MEHAFPTPFRIEFLSNAEANALYVAAFLSASSLISLCLTYFAKPTPKLVGGWLAAFVASPFALWIGHQVFANNWRHSAGATPWLNASFWSVLIVSILGAFLADIRLAKTGQQPCLYRLALRLLRYSLYATATIFLLMCLSWIFTPTISEARLPARRSRCKSNLKQLGIALHNYHKVHNLFPSAQISTPPISWRVQTLPYLDQEELWGKYVPENSWDSSTNEPIAKTQVSTFKCPSREHHANDKDDRDRFYTDYTMLTGGRALSGDNKATRMRDIVDGTSNTLAIVEATGLNIVWTEPRDADVTKLPTAINYSGNETYDSQSIASSWHRAGSHVLFSDGAVKFLSENTDPHVLKALTTIDGDEEIPWSEVKRH